MTTINYQQQEVPNDLINVETIDWGVVAHQNEMARLCNVYLDNVRAAASIRSLRLPFHHSALLSLNQGPAIKDTHSAYLNRLSSGISEAPCDKTTAGTDTNLWPVSHSGGSGTSACKKTTAERQADNQQSAMPIRTRNKRRLVMTRPSDADKLSTSTSQQRQNAMQIGTTPCTSNHRHSSRTGPRNDRWDGIYERKPTDSGTETSSRRCLHMHSIPQLQPTWVTSDVIKHLIAVTVALRSDGFGAGTMCLDPRSEPPFAAYVVPPFDPTKNGISPSAAAYLSDAQLVEYR